MTLPCKPISLKEKHNLITIKNQQAIQQSFITHILIKFKRFKVLNKKNRQDSL